LLLVARQDLREAETLQAAASPQPAAQLQLATLPILALLEDRLEEVSAPEAALEMA